MKHSWRSRIFWAIRFDGSSGDPMVIGTAWHKEANERNKGYVGEPSRALLFKTRMQARKYCAARRKEYATIGGVCAKWRFTPIRVRESVTTLNRSVK